MNTLLDAATQSHQAFKASVLAKGFPYASKCLVPIQSSGFLAAMYQTKKAAHPIFVIPGNFTRDRYKAVLAEANQHGLATDRIYVYGEAGVYSGASIVFTRLDSIAGLELGTPAKTPSIGLTCK